MDKNRHTHRISVNAFLICNDQFLLLRRAHPPVIWAPPGGHLLTDEDPIEGLQREILEETGLTAEIFSPVVTWFGEFKNSKLLSIDYCATTTSMSVRLSDEHTAFRWLTFEQLQKDSQIYFNSALGFTLEDFKLAWKTYLMLKNLLEELLSFSAGS